MTISKIQLGMLAAVLALGITAAGCRGDTHAGAAFGLTPAELGNIVSAGGNAGQTNFYDRELVIAWPESTQANFHAALAAVNASGNGEGTAQELLWGQILFAQTDRWELTWESTGADTGRMTFRIEPLSP
ncbi:MAG: hypothetical protein FWG66_04145 [Spirochaetes bacterium]|nr:hypothetical protein [Spirochaetota bacterium]